MFRAACERFESLSFEDVASGALAILVVLALAHLVSDALVTRKEGRIR